jgi:hypothetical protein
VKRDAPTQADLATLLEARDFEALYRDLSPAEVPEIPPRARLRPCCAFGADLRVRVGAMPVPGYEIGNLRGPADLGKHTYDSGVVTLSRDSREKDLFRSERNGQVYTCRGGFIDTAHVRDWIDSALYLAAEFGRHLAEGTEIVLSPEGASRGVVLRPVPELLIRRHGRPAVSLRLAQWAAFQLSIWHEIATWYGWSAVAGFPEKVSAFSPEDLYSNRLGVKLLAAIVSRGSARTEHVYNESTDVWLGAALEYLGAVPEEVGREAMQAVDGLWWDSTLRLPDAEVVKRRNLDTGNPLRPWLVPESRMSESLRAALKDHCGASPEPQLLANPGGSAGATYADWVTIEFELEDELAEQEPFASIGRRVTQAEFPRIIEAIRQQNLAEFGPRAGRLD